MHVLLFYQSEDRRSKIEYSRYRDAIGSIYNKLDVLVAGPCQKKFLVCGLQTFFFKACGPCHVQVTELLSNLSNLKLL